LNPGVFGVFNYCLLSLVVIHSAFVWPLVLERLLTLLLGI
jgi:hypothetical protein